MVPQLVGQCRKQQLGSPTSATIPSLVSNVLVENGLSSIPNRCLTLSTLTVCLIRFGLLVTYSFQGSQINTNGGTGVMAPTLASYIGLAA
jgi:hypothetical protein